MKRRVVITGLGAVTPLGNNVDDFWAGIREGKVGIGPITKFDTTDYKVKIAAEVKDFKAADYMDFKAAKRMENFSQYAVAAAKEAFAMAGLDMSQEDPYRVGVIIGSGVGSLQAIEREHQKLLELYVYLLNLMLVPMMISNMAAGNVSIQLGARGKCTDVVTACASGTHSIGDAFRAIQYGDAEVMIAGGTENAITPIGVSGFTNLTALTTCSDPERASIPFDKDRSGFVLGEGAGIVILRSWSTPKPEELRSWRRWWATAPPADAHHVTAPIEDGSGAAKAMSLAMEEAGVQPEDVDYINAHGTSTPLNDLSETRAIKLAFGEAAYNVKINSTKSMIGHLLGAAGGVECVVCVKSLMEGFIHQTVGSKETEGECDLNYCIGAPVQQEIRYAMTNSLGFGGHNATLLLKKWEG